MVITAFVAATQPAWAGHGGGGGGYFGGGGGGFHGGGGFGGGGFHGGGLGGGHFGGFRGSQFGGFHPAPAFQGGGFGAAPSLSGGGTRMAGTYYTGPSRASQVHYGPTARPFVRLDSSKALGNRSVAARPATVSRQQNRVGSLARQNSRISNSQISSSFRRAITDNRTSGRHDGNWHRDWDKNHFHHWGGHWWGWYGGYWIGFDPWYYPFGYDAFGANPSDYYGYPYGYSYDGYPGDNYYNDNSDPYNYSDDSSSASHVQPSDPNVSAVQSKLEQLGYYHSTVDGILGDETQAAIARYQEDHDLSVTGTLTPATLDSLGVTQTAEITNNQQPRN